MEFYEVGYLLLVFLSVQKVPGCAASDEVICRHFVWLSWWGVRERDIVA